MNIHPLLHGSSTSLSSSVTRSSERREEKPEKQNQSALFPGHTFPRRTSNDGTTTVAQVFRNSNPTFYRSLRDGLGSLQDSVRHGRTALGALSEAASFQRLEDKALGIGLRQGAQRFSTNVLRGAERFDRECASSLEEQAIAGGTAATSIAANGVLPFAGALYSGYNLIRNWGNADVATSALNGAAVGAYVGSVVPGVGTLVGGAIGGLLGAASGLFHKSGKHEDQLVRDKLRGALQDLGLLDTNFGIRRADGSTYDLGKDGGFLLENEDGSSRHTYDTDPSNPLASLAVGLVNPLVSLLVGDGTKASSDLAGLLANAALSNATSPEEVRRNVLQFASTLGLNEDSLTEALSSNLGEDSPLLAAYLNGAHTLYQPALLQEEWDQPAKESEQPGALQEVPTLDLMGAE